ncbi:ABC transporter substrate-binding protein [Actinomadura yumaensis]|uniref:ABC transporter substrate-binding protein n=1 Tax=Actinomadura yumaensis TaxID=111807 RepID=UPI00360FDA7D
MTTSDPAAFNTGWVGRVPVTAGPFRPRAIDQTAKTVTVVRDPAWWGRPAKLDRIVYRAMDPSAMPGAFANGEVDLMDIGVDAGALRRAKRVPGAEIRRAGGPDWRHFTFNAAAPFLADPRVRRAVMLAIDRRAVARSDLADLGWAPQPLGNHFYVNTQEGYQDNSGALGSYDPERARRLLDEAGWVPDGKYRRKDGRTLALRFVVPSSVPGSKQEGS